MTAQPTLQAPVAPLLSQIALLIREGVSGWIRPDPYAAPYWTGWDATERVGCPAGHFLLSEGTRLYLDDTRALVEPPYCVVALNGDPQPLDQRVPSAFWNVPVLVEMAWDGDDDNMQIRNRIGILLGLLCVDYPAAGAQPARPVKDRLSVADSLLVYGNDTITDVKPEPLRLADGHPVARLTFTVLCSALPPA